MKFFQSFSLSIFLFFLAESANACCALDFITISPRQDKIVSNSIFIIDFSERDFKFKTESGNFIFRLKTSSGFIDLKILHINFSGTMGQFVLQAKKKLKIGDSVSLNVLLNKTEKIDSVKFKRFSLQVANSKWKVAGEPDIESPIWKADSIKYQIEDKTKYSSVHSFTILFDCPILDNSLINTSNSSLIYYELTLGGNKYICTSDDFKTSIYSSICGRNFDFSSNEDLTVSIIPIDASGNYCSVSKKVIVKKDQ